MSTQAKPISMPAALKPAAKVLEDAGINIVYGPNPAPMAADLSDEAKKAWANLPNLPLPVKNPKQWAAMRTFTGILEKGPYEKFKDSYSLHDETFGGITTMLVTPPELKHKDKALIFLHGGAYVLNTRKTQLALQAAAASKLGVKVISIEYPLAPEHAFPAATNAIAAAYKGILEQYDATNLGLFGTSAGGSLVLATLMRLKHDGLPLPAASAALSPEADLSLSGDTFTLVGHNDPMLPVQGMIDSAATHVGSGDAKDPMISAVYGDYTGVPPLFLLGGTRELIGSEAWRTAARAREHGCEVTLVTNDGMWHMAIADGSGVPEEQYAFDQMMRFFNKNLIKG